MVASAASWWQHLHTNSKQQFGSQLAELALPVGILVCVVILLVPLPTAIMDFLLAVNLAVAVLMLLTAIQVRSPLDFGVFPTLLLVTTLARLVLNVATTRLILSNAETGGAAAAGHVVQAFSSFVAGSHLMVGIILFLILVIVQFVVITKGATRISEVSARFALDGMPGRQMAVDADLQSGTINETEAQNRREGIQREADFYSAMDGASKFVRGDAIAGLLITTMNIVGGLLIGILQLGMDFSQAAELFTRLTIGDGLVSQVPALMISVAAGLLLTRANHSHKLSSQVVNQLVLRPETLMLTGVLFALLIFTGLPVLPLLALGAGAIGLSIALKKPATEQPATRPAPSQTTAEPRVEDFLHVDPIVLEIGVGLIRLADPKRGGNLLTQIQQVRHTIARELGIILPKVRIRDNVRLDRQLYQIKLSDLVIAQGEIHPTLALAIDWGTARKELAGIQATEPTFGLPGIWIDPETKTEAEKLGYHVAEPSSLIATHLTEVIRKHAAQLLTRETTKQLIENLRKESPAVVEELIPDRLSLGEVHRVLQLLIEEGVPIRTLSTILETIGDHCAQTSDAQQLAECVRSRLGRVLYGRYCDSHGVLRAIRFSNSLEHELEAMLENCPWEQLAYHHGSWVGRFCQSVDTQLTQLSVAGHPQVLLVNGKIRSAVRQLLQSQGLETVVLSYREVGNSVQVQVAAEVTSPFAVVPAEAA